MPVEILLIEDNGADVRIIKEIVAESSVPVRITVAENGEQALALLADPQFKPDLVVTDMILQKSSIAEVFQRCNASGIPMVVFSGSERPRDKEEALRLGAKEFIEKPADLDAYVIARNG